MKQFELMLDYLRLNWLNIITAIGAIVAMIISIRSYSLSSKYVDEYSRPTSHEMDKRYS